MKLYITDLSLYVLLIFYLPLVLFALWRIVMSKSLGKVAKAVMIPVFLAIAYAIPLGDVTRNSIAMAKACPNAGLHVYKQVKVEGYFDRRASGQVLELHPYKFIEYTRPGQKVTRLERQADGRFTKSTLDTTSAKYEIVYEEWSYDKEIGAKKLRYWVRDRENNEVIGERLVYDVVPGWLDRAIVVRWFGGGGIPTCGANQESSSFQEKILQPLNVKE